MTKQEFRVGGLPGQVRDDERRKIVQAIKTVLDQLDGTEATAVSLITGLSLDDLGGV